MAWTVVGEERLAPGFGPLLLVADGGCLTRVVFAPFGTPDGERADDDPVLVAAADQLEEYFAGRRQEFDLPLRLVGSAFQRRVWEQLSAIGYGETISYGELARRLGLPPGASRAVGLSNGSNPVPVVVPCHRVIGADGTLTGFGGGLHRKRILLDVESSPTRLF